MEQISNYQVLMILFIFFIYLYMLHGYS